ncbi:MAG: 5-bromo-4-chloroindolyl phosphate hydrolysis family protein [Lachnospiraceae bacterium]|nr:5-bromo-4-chloroindolyl phosphate hydrolysis family protein [Lachnospiraceae bacterium]
MTEAIRKFHPNEPGSVAGIVYCVLGCVMIFGGLTIVEFEYTQFYMVENLGKGMKADHVIMIAGACVWALLGLALIAVGIFTLKMIYDFRKIKAYLGDRELVSVREMAEDVHCTEAVMRRRLRAMIRKNLFLQGHINVESTFFLLTDELYEQYQEAVALWKEQEKEWKKLGFREEEQILLEKVRPYEYRMEQAASREEDVQVHACLERMSQAVERLLDAAAQNPANLSSLHTFLNYFLPTADKLIAQYQQLPKEKADTGNVHMLQIELPKALEEMAEAFEKMTEQLCEQLELEITSDVYAIRIIMEQHCRLGVAV